MPLGIYKPGQGYWVRVMTAIGVGVLVLAGASWAWAQAATIDLPTKNFIISVTAVTGELTAGDQVELLRPAATIAEQDELVGLGVIEDYQETGRTARIVVGQLDPGAKEEGLTTTRLRAGSETAPTFRAEVQSGGIDPTPIFQIEYLKAGAAGVFLLFGAIVIYWYVGSSNRPVEFLIATDGEMKKVNWSTPKEIRGSTVVVIVAAFLIATILFAIDWVFGQIFRALDVLQV